MGWKRKPKEFVCPFCNADFDKKRQFKQHVKDKHSYTISDHYPEDNEPYFKITKEGFGTGWSEDTIKMKRK